MLHNAIIENKGYSDLNPVQFGYEKCKALHSYGPAIRTHWLIHYIFSGTGIYKINKKSYTVKPGEMFVIPPYVETYYEADSENPWNYIWIGFTTQRELPFELSDIIVCPEAEKIFIQMKKCDDYSDGRSAYLTARLWDLFGILSEERSKKTDYIQNALDFIHSEYMNNITVEKIAGILNLDRTYFSALFKKKTGLSPKQYLLNYRMNTAANLILKNHISVSVAANSVGYNDLFTFSRMFKRHFGLSPSEYARQKK